MNIERKIAVDKMKSNFNFPEKDQEILSVICYHLYDLGYREMEDNYSPERSKVYLNGLEYSV